MTFSSTSMLITSPQQLSSALRHNFHLVGLLSELVLRRGDCGLLVLSGSEKRWFGILKDMIKVHFWWHGPSLYGLLSDM